MAFGVIDILLDDAEIGTWRQRAAHAKHWQEEFEAMEKCTMYEMNFCFKCARFHKKRSKIRLERV
jgi:hypothetical protein